MSTKDRDYLSVINNLTDFHNQATTLASNIAGVCNSTQLADISTATISLIDQYSSLMPITNTLPELANVSYSPAINYAREANIAISGLTEVSTVNNLVTSISSKPDSLITGINPTCLNTETIPHGITLESLLPATNIAMTNIDSSLQIDRNLLSTINIESTFSKLSATSILAESTLSGFRTNDIGSLLGLNTASTAQFNNAFVEMSESYSTLFRTVQEAPQSIINLNTAIIQGAPIEYLTSTTLCRTISTIDKPIAEYGLISRQISSDNQFELEKNLSKIDSGCVRVWQGASMALESNNPDKVRHFCVSIRELLRTILDSLAPDDKMREWSTKQEYYKDDKPTREGKLFYISRNINMKSFHKFVQKDIAATLEFIRLFQEGTHKIEVAFTDDQLFALKTKAESTINFLITIGL